MMIYHRSINLSKKIIKLSFEDPHAKEDFCDYVWSNMADDRILKFYNRKNKIVCKAEMCANGAIITNWWGEQYVYEFGLTGATKGYDEKCEEFIRDLEDFEVERI